MYTCSSEDFLKSLVYLIILIITIATVNTYPVVVKSDHNAMKTNNEMTFDALHSSTNIMAASHYRQKYQRYC
jgi:hypothetical protein